MKRAVLIGINYFGTKSELQGCHNDVDGVGAFLGGLGYEMTVMKDGTGGTLNPTRANILRELGRAVAATGPGDTLFIHYSGHGSYGSDLSGDELDKKDEFICPVDGEYIRDDELYVLLVAGLHPQGRIRAIFDCCHSGTILDARYRWRIGESIYVENKKSFEEKDILMISGCMDSQTSADALIAKKYAGALTWGFLQSLEYISFYTWKDLLMSIRDKLSKDRYDQIPQLSYDRINLQKLKVDL